MNDGIEVSKPDGASVHLGRLLGRREAFSLIAGRCSAAEAESLRRLRDEKLYVGFARSWEEFCEQELKASRRSINRLIGYLEEFGPQYFDVVQMTRISPQQYRAIAAHVNEAGVNLNGEVVALLPDNRQKVADAVSELLQHSRTVPPQKETSDFADALKRCESAADILESAADSPDPAEQRALGVALKRLRVAGRRFGVLFDR